jgi:hypothetical protein
MNRTRARALAIVTARAVALYAFAGWVYVAGVALAQPHTLPWQLTHLSSFPRTDTFGEACFVVSFAAYWIHGWLTRPAA